MSGAARGRVGQKIKWVSLPHRSQLAHQLNLWSVHKINQLCSCCLAMLNPPNKEKERARREQKSGGHQEMTSQETANAIVLHSETNQ